MKSSATPPGPPLIGALLRMPVDAVRRRLLDGLHAGGFTDVVPAHLNILRYPGPQGRRPSDLAEETDMTRQATNYLLGQLEQLGYLVRQDDPDDGRSRRVELTERGHAAQQTMRAAMSTFEAELERDLGRADFAQLKELLVRLNASPVVRSARATTATGD